MQFACAILSSVACPALQYFSTLSPKRYDFREKLLNTKHVLWLYLKLLAETFLILRITERGMIKNVYRSSYKVAVIIARF